MGKLSGKERGKIMWTLFWTFCRIGVLTFGGGYAMLPMIQKEVVEKHKWATDEEVMDYFAIGQCTPGVIAVNTATFIGYKYGGILGGFVATAGVVFPSLIIIMVIAAFISNFAHLEWVQHAFAGIRVAVSVLIVNAIVKLWKTGVKDWIGILIFAVSLILTLALDLSPIILIVASMLVGIFIKRERKPRKGGDKA